MEEFNSQKDGFLPRGNLSWWDRTVGLRRRRLNVRELWKTAYGDLKDDLKRTRWLRGFGWFAAVLWLFGLIATACVIGIMTLSSTETACQPDGQFRLHPDEFTMWSSSGFFQITLGGGELTFTEAKVIDIVWDIVSPFRDLRFLVVNLPANPGRWARRTVCARVYLSEGVQAIPHHMHGSQTHHFPNIPDYFSRQRNIVTLYMWHHEKLTLAAPTSIKNGCGLYDSDYDFHTLVSNYCQCHEWIRCKRWFLLD
jgi:hypothetical protein